MSTSIEVRTESAPALPAEAHWAIRLCTSNPFYVVSAGLFLAGLWLSCDPEKAEDTWALMAGLTGYTLLLAGTAYLLIRFARVWDDARTVLLLVVLMFLATSVTFDRTLVFEAAFEDFQHAAPSWVWNVLGLAIAMVVSEALLYGVRLSLPGAYRLPYYLLLALFFLYPLGLARFVNEPHSEEMMFGLFAFSSVAALIFLTLLPAVWRGGADVSANGSPWPYPLYPWTLFGLLACAVPCRAILLCYSMHLLDVRDLYEVTFGFYFLAPLGLVLALLLLEAGLTAKHSGVIWTALGAPVVLIVLSTLGHRDEPIYREFLDLFQARLGVGPVWFTLLLSAGFYAYASLRLAPFALEALTATLALTMVIDPGAVDLHWTSFGLPHPAVLIALSTVLLGLGIWRKVSWRCLLGAYGLAAGLTLIVAGEVEIAPYRWLIAYHLALAVTLIIGTAFDDELAHALRFIGAFVALVVCLGVMFLPLRLPPNIPEWSVTIYPPIIAGLLIGFGLLRWNPATLTLAGFLLGTWSLAIGWEAYRVVRQLVIGMDYLVLSLAVFVLAVAISLGKAGLLSSWIAAWRPRSPDVPE